MAGLIHVAVAVIEDVAGRILLARRPEHVHQGGLWEFPGGKLEPGESIADGLRREIHEELGVEVVAHRPLIRITHHYGDREVLLDTHRVTALRGEPHGREGQPLAWVAADELGSYPLPAADRPIVTALRLPDRYLITGADPNDTPGFLRRLTLALESGIRLVQLRATVDEGPYQLLARAAADLCHRMGARLLLNAAPGLVERVGADGVHLNSRRLVQLERRPLPDGLLVAASCHNAQELARAEQIGVDFALLSPVLPTASHPEALPLGWEGFRKLVDEVAVPVYALGGMQSGMIAEAWAQGAQGIAAIRGLWPPDS